MTNNILNKNVDINNKDKIYRSNNCGEFKIIKYLGSSRVRIKFINTGFEKDVKLCHVQTGSIRDNSLFEVYPGEIYSTTKCGNVEIIDRDIKNRYATIKFINTGFEKIARFDHIISGNVKDDSLPTVFGIGEYGNISKNYRDIKNYYNIWNSMMSRCYNINYKEYNSYGAKGVKVSDAWLIFENFYNDVQLLYNHDKYLLYPYEYQLDKDYLQLNKPPNQRIYSKETCIFLYKYDNLNLSIIENNNNPLGFGIKQTKNGYTVNIKINNINRFIGEFNNLDAARSAYNYFSIQRPHELVPILNQCSNMPPLEFIKYNINKTNLCINI